MMTNPSPTPSSVSTSEPAGAYCSSCQSKWPAPHLAWCPFFAASQSNPGDQRTKISASPTEPQEAAPAGKYAAMAAAMHPAPPPSEQASRIAYLEAALRLISEGRGRFSRDQLIFAGNTIEDMKETAVKALAGTWEMPE